MVCVAGDPTDTFPKLALAGVMVSPACTPVPATGITALVPCELATVMLPAMFSALFGLNTTLIVAFCPAFNVTGAVIPLTVTSFALTLICEIVKLLFPLFVTVTLFVLELPAFTFPKLRLVGFDESVTDAAVPLPLSATTLGEFAALLVMLTDPVRLPEVVGANTTLNVAFAPAAMVAGVVSPLTLYPLPLTVNCPIVTAAVPVLLIVIVCDFVCPSTTLPKLKLVGDTLSPVCDAVPVPLNATLIVGFTGSVLVTLKLPVELLAAVGENVNVS